jgi:hypothetical protein
MANFACAASPSPTQVVLLDRLGIVRPKRLRLTELDLPVEAASLSRPLHQNCSADFSFKALNLLFRAPDSAQVGLITVATVGRMGAMDSLVVRL